MTDKHTPGPWILESYTSGGETRFFVRTRGAIQVDDDGPILGFAIAGGIREADAPLIAAAPEMRKALEAIGGSKRTRWGRAGVCADRVGAFRLKSWRYA